MCTYPSLFLSMMLGVIALMYVHVHMRSSTTRRRDSKLNKADYLYVDDSEWLLYTRHTLDPLTMGTPITTFSVDGSC